MQEIRTRGLWIQQIGEEAVRLAEYMHRCPLGLIDNFSTHNVESSQLPSVSCLLQTWFSIYRRETFFFWNESNFTHLSYCFDIHFSDWIEMDLVECWWEAGKWFIKTSWNSSQTWNYVGFDIWKLIWSDCGKPTRRYFTLLDLAIEISQSILPHSSILVSIISR